VLPEQLFAKLGYGDGIIWRVGGPLLGLDLWRGRGTEEVGGEGEGESDVLSYVELVFCWT
jgi:hypothetical protein